MKENKNIERIIIAVCAAILLPLAIVGFYNRASADDYNYALITHEAIENNEGFFGLLTAAVKTDIQFYNSWQGLYTSAFLLSLQPGIFNEKLYILTFFIIFSIAILTVYLSIQIINKRLLGFSRWYSFSAAMIIITMLFLWLPSANQGLYWFNGAVNYMPWAFTNILQLALLFELMYLGKGSKKYFAILIIATLMSFLTSGGNHVTAFANILMLIIYNVYLIIKKRYYALLPLISSVFGFIIMYIAPGTSIRQAEFVNPTIIETIIGSANYFINMMDSWLSIQIIIVLLLLTPFILKIAQSQSVSIIKIRFPWVGIICGAVIMCGMMCVPYYAMGYFGDPRLTNVLWITHVFFVIINYSITLIWAYQKRIIRVDKVNMSKKRLFGETIIATACLFAVFYLPHCSIHSNSYIAISEMKNGVAREYQEAVDKRIELIKASESDVVVVDPIPTSSKLLFFSDITEDPKYWSNDAFGKFYKKTIYVKAK